MTSAPPRGIVALEWPVLVRAARYLPAVLSGRAFTMTRAHADFLCLNQLSPEQREWAFPRFGPESGRATREMALGGIGGDAAAVRRPNPLVAASPAPPPPTPLPPPPP